MQEPIPAAPAKEDLEDSASALLDAIVRAGVELHALQERCSSLELAISLGREAVDTAESLPAEATAAKSTSGNGTPARSPASGEISLGPAPVPASAGTAPDALPEPELTEALTPAMAPIKPPAPLSIPTPKPTKAAKAAEPVAQPAAALVASPAAAPAVDPEEPAVSPSLEEQAAALRAAMGNKPSADGQQPTAGTDAHQTRPEPTKTQVSRAEAPTEATEHGPGPFKPKRATPLKSRLAGLDVTAAKTESESYSERSAELEQLLRHRNDG
ncbi:MAG: hypothetical protein ACJ758_08750 [Actinomycetota bacterium]